MEKILLEGMEFYAYHGHFAEEQAVGNYFEVDIAFTTDLSRPSASDDLADAVDYQLIYRIVSEEMAIVSKLIEHVSRRIIERIMDTFAQITEVEVKLSKKNPPMGGRMRQVSVLRSLKR